MGLGRGGGATDDDELDEEDAVLMTEVFLLSEVSSFRTSDVMETGLDAGET